MPYTSAHISGMVGGQTAMFSNNAAFAQQIGGQFGTGPMTGGGGMQNPFPIGAPPSSFGMVGGEDTGAQIAGGLGQAIPGALTGVSIAGAMAGGPLAGLDPFTMGGRGLRAGIGAPTGAGIRGTLGFLGQGFRTGGIRGGLGMLGRGAVGAAGAAALPLAAFALAEKAGSSIYAGAQDVSEVGQIAQTYMGPQTGQPGARGGGQLGRHQIRGIVSMMSEIASDDVMTSMDDLKRLMDRAGQMGMLTGAGGVEQFKRNFKQIVDQTRSVAQIMGTTLDQAMPVVGQLTQMGMWSTRDIMGTAVAARAAGPMGTQAMMGTMQAGAQMAHAMGGRLGAGAVMGREMFGNIQAAMQTGAITQQQLREFTGGVGGAEGMRQMATSLTGQVAQLSRTAGGRLSMAALGEVQEGRFTGRMDVEAMERFKAGEIGIGELQQMARGKTGTRAGALSFTRRQEMLGQEFGAQAGLEGMGSLLEAVTAKAGLGGAGEDAQALLLQKMTGASARTTEAMLNLKRQMPMLREQKLRTAQAAMEQAFRDLDEKQNRSWQGVKDAVGHAWEETWKPFREFGSDFATQMGEASDDMATWFFGRSRRIPVTQRERAGALRRGVLTQSREQMTQRLQQDFGFGAEGDRLESGFTDYMRAGGGLGGGLMDWMAPGDFGPRSERLLRQGGRFRTQAARLWGEGQGREGEIGLGSLAGTEVFMRRGERQRVATEAFKRAADPTRGALGLGGKDVEQRSKIEANMGVIKDAVAQVWRDPRTANILRNVKENNPRDFEKTMIGLVKAANPEAAKAMKENRDLMPSPPMVAGERELVDSRELSLMAIAQSEMKRTGSELAIDFGEGLELPDFSDAESVRKFEAEQVDKIADLAGVSRGVVEEVVGRGMLGDVQQYVRDIKEGKAPGETRFTEAEGAAGELRTALQKMVEGGIQVQAFGDIFTGGEERMGGLQKAIGGLGISRQRTIQQQEVERIQKLAQRSRQFGEVRGVGEETVSGLNELIGAYGRGDIGAGTEQAEALAAGITDPREMRALSRTGGFGAQVASLAGARGLEAGEAKEFRGQLEKISGLAGFDVMGAMDPTQRKAIEGKLKEGVTAEEAGEIKGTVTELLKRMGPAQGRGAKKDAMTAQQEFLEQYTKATSATKDFVQVTEQAVMSLQGTDLVALMKAGINTVSGGGEEKK